jgi:hypothetical protein
MRRGVAQERYLQRHIEENLPDAPGPRAPWQQVVVIPAYRESPELLRRMAQWTMGAGRVLVILVLNRPDSDSAPHDNDPLRNAIAAVSTTGAAPCAPNLISLNDHTDLYVLDLDTLTGPIPATQGVGLARKFGCDLAFNWIHQGIITSQWIGSSDADALLPPDYFSQLQQLDGKEVAAIYPFRHVPGPDPACNAATVLYELRLHHYVLGLEYAGSPYAHHALGSCLAVKADYYAQVRGFPKRSGGEDFYLLDKLAKLGPIARLKGECIALQSRHSRRAPFGTGPAVAKISAAAQPMELPLFYHPASFEALRGLLAAVPSLQESSGTGLQALLGSHPAMRELQPALARACSDIIVGMGLENALAHCRAQGKSPQQFLRQFHQWFDGFRTLKFIHQLRDAGWPQQSFTAQCCLQPQVWPQSNHWDIGELCRAAQRHWGWAAGKEQLRN